MFAGEAYNVEQGVRRKENAEQLGEDLAFQRG
jgi:hypothetical protein